MIRIKRVQSPLGSLILAEQDNALAGLWFEGQRYFFHPFQKERTQWTEHPVFQQTEDWLKRYFAQGRPDPNELPLKLVGSDFQKLVWHQLLKIPYGTCVSYGALAQAAAAVLQRSSMAAQAVGSAVGHNPISIVIPCHRIIGSDGNLTGYAGGIERKLQLLKLEQVDCRSLFWIKQGRKKRIQ